MAIFTETNLAFSNSSLHSTRSKLDDESTIQYSYGSALFGRYLTDMLSFINSFTISYSFGSKHLKLELLAIFQLESLVTDILAYGKNNSVHVSSY